MHITLRALAVRASLTLAAVAAAGGLLLPHGSPAPVPVALTASPGHGHPLLSPRHDPVIADCDAQVHMLKRRISSGLSGIRIVRQAKAHAFCSPLPRQWNSQIIMQKWNKRHQRWYWIGFGPVRHSIPDPDATYWLNKPCSQGRFRAGLGVWGISSTGQEWPELIQWSKVLRIANCQA